LTKFLSILATGTFALLVLSSAVAVPYPNFVFTVQEANAQSEIELSGPSVGSPTGGWVPADGRIFYVQASTGIGGDLFVRAEGSQLSTWSTDQLPRGIMIVPAGPPGMLRVSVQRMDIPNDQLPSAYSIGFRATRDVLTDNPATGGSILVENTTDASILIVLEPAERSLPKLSFDKSTYSRGESATLILNDSRIDCSASSFATPTISVDVAGVGFPTFPVNLSRDLRDPTSLKELRHTFTIPATATGDMRATARVVSPSCVFPPMSATIDVAATTSISLSGIRFDKTTYSVVNDEGLANTIRLEVVDENYPDPSLEATLNIAIESEDRTASSVRETRIPLERIDERTFRADIPATNFTNIPFTEGIARVSAIYEDADSEDPVASATLLPRTSLSFSENRTSFGSDELVTLELVSAENNTNPNDFDSAFATVCSFMLDGTPVPGGRSIIPLAETGRDTGIFGSLYHLSFVNATFDVSLIPELSEQIIFEQSVIRVPEDRIARITANIGNSMCDPVIPTASARVPSVTLSPVAPDDYTDPARGEVSGARAHNSPPLVTATAINCVIDNYGGDTDKDGICDNWEPGSPNVLTIWYPAGTASPHTFSYTCDPCPSENHKDVFVEIDFVNNANSPACPPPNDKSWRPDTTLPNSAIQNVIDAFNEGHVSNPGSPHSPSTGVKMHIYVDEDVASSCLTEVDVWRELTTDGADDSFDEIKQAKFGDGAAERASTNKGKAKWQVFHYGLFIPKQAQDLSSSGVAEQIGNDFVVSLGVGGVFVNNYAHQQGTLMHELGHNLGLHHGGYNFTSPYLNDYNTNCKPNYVSVMSYMRQITNPYSNASLLYSEDVMLTANADQRKLSRSPTVEWNSLGISSASWYSSVEVVWGKDGSMPPARDVYAFDMQNVDWDNSGVIENTAPYNQDVLDTGVTGCDSSTVTEMWGANDWSNLQYDFRSKNTPAFATGFHSGEYQNYPIEGNSTIATQIFLEGIEMLNIMVQNLTDDSVDFSDEAAIHFQGNDLEDIQEEFEERLITNKDSVFNLISKTLDYSTIVGLNNTIYLHNATGELLDLRTQLDRAEGGDPDDDTLSPTEDVVAILRFMDDNIAALKVAVGDEFILPGHFDMNSYDKDCAGDSSPGCELTGYSESVTGVADTFRIDEDMQRVTMAFVGQGPVTLVYPDDLMSPDPVKVYHVISNDGGRRLDFKVHGDNSTTLLGLPFYPRDIALFYGFDLVHPSDLEINPGRAYVGRESTIEFSLSNYIEFYQPYTAILEVRNANATTVQLNLTSGILSPEELDDDFVLPWTPEEEGMHQIRLFVISDLEHPEVLSLFELIDMNVTGAFPEPEFSSDPPYRVGDTVEVLIMDDYSNRDSRDDDEIPNIRVSSSSDIVGEEFTAEELDDNLGFFELTFKISSASEPGAVVARAGDYIDIEFEDERGIEFMYSFQVGPSSSPTTTNSTTTGNSTMNQ